MDDAPIDLRPIFRSEWPSYGPDWDAAIEMGVDIAALERNLALTPEQRLVRLQKAIHAIAVLRGGLVRG